MAYLDFAGKTLGLGVCPDCGCETARYVVSKKGHVVRTCPAVGDGGCNHQSFSRSEKSDALMVRHITKWYSPDARREILGDEALPAKAREPEPKPEAKPEPRPEPIPARPSNLLEKILDTNIF